jgi:hypothetical protein
MQMKNRTTYRVGRTALAVMCLWGVSLPAEDSTPGGQQGTERRYQASIVSVEPAQKTVRIRHKPTHYETDLVWTDKSVVRANIKYDIDDLREGWVECWVNTVDSDAKAITGVAILRELPAGSQPPEKAGEPKEKSLFRARLVRQPIDVSTLKDDRYILTGKRDARYELDINGTRWTLESKHGVHPPLNHDVLWTTADLKPGLPCREVVYQENKSGNSLTSILVLPNQNFKPAMPPGGPTGTTVERINQELKRLRDAYSKVATEIRKTAPVTLQVKPEIVMKGEPITLTIEAWASKTPNPVAELVANHLQPKLSSKKDIPLVWTAKESVNGLTRYVAKKKLPELSVGQHYLRWNCDIGGDIQEFWRSFAVTDLNTLVVMLHFTAGKPNVEFDEFNLPYDYWEESPLNMLGGPFSDRKTPKAAYEWTDRSKEYRRRGANPNCHIIQGNYAGRVGWPAPIPVQFLLEPEAVQRAVFKASMEIGKMCGFTPSEFGYTGYEFGTRTAVIAREAGIRLVGSMCIHQNWQDGSWGINHSARPLRPYYSAPDDFRKAGPGGKDGLLMISQHDKSILWTEYGVGVFEPCWLEKAWLGGGGGRAEYDEIFMSRHFDLLNAAIDNVKNQKVPYFQSIGIEFSGEPEKIDTVSNALMIRYAVKRAQEGTVVFCNQGAAADFYRRHHTETPETLFYDADYWCGNKADDSIISTWKPVDYPDLIHIENSRYSAFFKKPVSLPEYHWDYTKPWNYPDWGNTELPRSPMGFLVPGEHDKFAVTPSITDTRKMKVSQSRSENAGGLEIVVTLETAEAIKALPLAVWDIPREWKAGEGWWQVKGANRFVPICAPYTGNLNGILEVDAKPGKNEYRLTIATPKRTPQSQDILLKTVHAKVFTRDGQTMAYIWPTRPWETTFELEVPAGKSVQYYAAPQGEKVELKPGKHPLTIPKEKWARIVGLSREELAANLREAKQP